MKNKNSSTVDFPLWQLFFRSFSAANKVREKELDRHHSTPRQSAVLSLVERLGQRSTPTEIARQLFVETHTISEQVSRMEKDGLVKRIKDLERKNLVRIEVTQKGHSLYLKTLNQKAIDKIFSALTEEEKLQFSAILEKIRRQAIKKLDTRRFELYLPPDLDDLPEQADNLAD